MLRTALIIMMVIFTVLPLLVGAWRLTETAPPSRLTTPQEVTPPTETVRVPPVIAEINARNAKVRSFAVDSMRVKVWQNGMRVKIRGSMHYEKDNNFRMILSTVFGDEVDLGSNDILFWYWSRRSKHDGLFYARHEDYNRTRLKTPFNPIFIKKSLGLNQVNLEGGVIRESDETVVVVHLLKNSMGKPIYRYLVVDKRSRTIVGFFITDTAGKTLAIAEILENRNGLPMKIMYTWYEENKILLLEFDNPRVNEKIDPSRWNMPNIQPQIDIGVE